jgi:predicted HAD superfamily Cof-like phosphohydrolase
MNDNLNDRLVLDFVSEVCEMHDKYGFHDKIRELTSNMNEQEIHQFRTNLLNFRLSFMEEEMKELETAVKEHSREGVVDSLIDLIVVAIGTLDLFNINVRMAWMRVMAANMEKKVGIKPTRPNPLGLPDLIKPRDWEGPDHWDNHGDLP